MFEGEFQLYGRIIDAKIKYQNSDIFTKRLRKAQLLLSDSSCRGTNRIYIIILLINNIEFINTINKKKIIDKELWQKWENYTISMMTIPTFRKI
ncbi:MAG TPA: hypothetical protein VF047_07625 [Nitrososphaeraceae archaeon]